MSKAKARVFVPLTKVDEEQRLVYGTITQEVLDKSGEVMDYETSKPNFEKWSNDIHTASGGLSKGNLRVMHGLSVAGKLTDLAFNDEDKSIEVCSKVVDDAEWNKVLEGCYTGFSVGGKYGKKWKETIDGAVIQKFTAVPNEVSLVDNPCCPSATFTMVKADGAEEEVTFQAAQEESQEASEQEQSEETPPAQADEPTDAAKAVTNEQVAARATEMAKAANNGSAWTDHIEAARDELVKAAQEGTEGGEGTGEGEEAETVPAASDAGETSASDEDAGSDVQKVTPPGVRQQWVASDGQGFDKKEDCVAHEEKLLKAAEPETEADKLAARLDKAVNPGEPEESLPLFEDFDRLGKAVQALITPFGEDGKPKLEKGMYTINRFSSVLSDLASLSRCIKAEGKREGDDATDSTVSADLLAAVKTLGTSFITYAQDQVTELLAGMDDDVVVSYHDYYYNAVQVDPEDGLAKDVCSLINDLREPAKETRETLAKAFGFIIGEEIESDDELSPPMQKRFNELEADNEKLKKIAETAVEKVEEFAKRLQAVEETPLPRAPNGHVAMKTGDSFLGKAASTDEDRMVILKEMLEKHGPDGMATLMIKAAQQNGHQLSLKQ